MPGEKPEIWETAPEQARTVPSLTYIWMKKLQLDDAGLSVLSNNVAPAKAPEAVRDATERCSGCPDL